VLTTLARSLGCPDEDNEEHPPQRRPGWMSWFVYNKSRNDSQFFYIKIRNKAA
jgi:hypothetical protein